MPQSERAGERPIEPSLFQRWARQQRVQRPFEALLRMGHESRVEIAEQMGINLETAWADAVLNCNYDLVLRERPRRSRSLVEEAEAAIIIGMDGRGIQARSHGTGRTLAVGTRNHSWREVLESVVRELRIPVRENPETPTIEELESAIYEWVAEKAVKEMSAEELDEVEKFLEMQPEMTRQLSRAGFGPKGMRLVAKGIFKAASRGGFGTYITAVRAAAFLNKTIGTKFVMKAVTAGLKTVLRSINAILWAWLVKDILDLLFGPSRGRLVGVISMIHQFYLLERLDAADAP